MAEDVDGAYWAQPTTQAKQHIFGDVYETSSNCNSYRDMAVLTAPKQPVSDDDEYNPETDCKDCARKAGLLDEDGGSDD